MSVEKISTKMSAAPRVLGAFVNAEKNHMFSIASLFCPFSDVNSLIYARPALTIACMIHPKEISISIYTFQAVANVTHN